VIYGGKLYYWFLAGLGNPPMNTPSCDPSWMHPKQVAAAARCGLLESTVGSFADQPSALLPINRRRQTPAMNPGTCRVLRASGAHTAHDALDALPPRTTRLTRSRFNTAAVPTTQLRKRLSNGIRKQTDTGVYLTFSS
jgi:hypothetical protein